MGLFWFIAVLFIAIALAFLLPPLLKAKRTVGKTVEERKELTISIYQDQFDELENDLKNSTISEEQYESAKADIERNLLGDIQLLEDSADTPEVIESRNKVPAIVVGATVPVFAILMYLWLGAGEPGIVPGAAPSSLASQSPEHQRQSIEKMVTQLEARLQAQPNDGEGWVMLARTYQFLKRYDDAVKAFERVVQLGGGQDVNILSSYADAVAMAAGRRITPKAENLLEKALEVDPTHVKSLWLAGTAAYQNENYRKAMEYWERLYNVLPPGSEDANQIAANINEVRGFLGMPAFAGAQPQPPMMGMNGSGAAASQASASSGSAQVLGNVTLSGAVASQASPDDTVFVFARAADGPRMPLAIVRKTVRDLPFDFKLTDAMAMNPNMKLSSFARVVVGARISKSGDAMPQSGDLQGFSKVIRVSDAGPANIVIDSVVE
jgi:cytochrome c-type biogenesis protein CcmH